MSRPALDALSSQSAPPTLSTATPARSTPDSEEVALVLAQMTPTERTRAYTTGVFTLRELNGAAGVRPDLVPIVNDEYEWIALTMADLD
jgi:hypothetical protein